MPDLAGIEKVLFLQSVELFRHCSAEQVLRLAAIARERRFETGADIFEPGDPARYLFHVVQGEICLESPNAERERVGPLGTFGAAEILCGRLRSRRASAVSATLVLAMEAEDLFDLLANNIEIVKALFRQFMPASPPPIVEET